MYTLSDHFIRQLVVTQCLKTCRHGKGVQLLIRPLNEEEMCDLRYFDCEMTVGAKHSGLSMSETADLLGC